MNLHEDTSSASDNKKVLTHEERLAIIMAPLPIFHIIVPQVSIASYGPFKSYDTELRNNE